MTFRDISNKKYNLNYNMQGKITLITEPDFFENDNAAILFMNLTAADQDIASSFLKNSNIKNVVVIGNLSNYSKKFLEKLLNLEVLHVQLPFGNIDDFKKYIPVLHKDQICIITLPTPKQEILANYISENQNFFRIFCFGAAVAMASGDEKSLPDKYLNLFFAEALWRLQFEPKRRIKRLIETFIYYLKGELVGKYNKLKFKVLNEKF